MMLGCSVRRQSVAILDHMAIEWCIVAPVSADGRELIFLTRIDANGIIPLYHQFHINFTSLEQAP